MSKIIKPFRWIRRHCERGVTLIEIIVALAIGGVVSAIVAAVFVYAMEQFSVLVERNASEESLLWSAYQTRALMGQAIDLRVYNAALGGIPMAGNTNGWILSSWNSATQAGNTAALALFVRESQSAGTASQLVSTGVFAVAPMANVPTGSSGTPYGGVVYFDVGQGGAMLSSTPDDIWFDRFSRIELREVECVTANGTSTDPVQCHQQPAKSATLVLKVRTFKTTNRSQWIWQEPTAIPAGVQVAAYSESEMVVKVGFRNNSLGTSRVGGTGVDRLHGGLYFFRMPLPRLGP